MFTIMELCKFRALTLLDEFEGIAMLTVALDPTAAICGVPPLVRNYCIMQILHINGLTMRLLARDCYSVSVPRASVRCASGGILLTSPCSNDLRLYVLVRSAEL